MSNVNSQAVKSSAGVYLYKDVLLIHAQHRTVAGFMIAARLSFGYPPERLNLSVTPCEMRSKRFRRMFLYPRIGGSSAQNSSEQPASALGALWKEKQSVAGFPRRVMSSRSLRYETAGPKGGRRDFNPLVQLRFMPHLIPARRSLEQLY